MLNPEIICLGEALIDITPPSRGASIITTGEMRMAAGGAPANVAVGLARLGTATGFLGRVGADFFGYHLKAVLTKNGVETSQLHLDNRANTAVAFVTWDEQGEASYLFYRNISADTLLHPDDIDPHYIKQARLLQFGSLLLTAEPSAAATYQALRIASEVGTLLSYDINLRLTAWPSEAAALVGITAPLAFTNILKLNRHELEFLTSESDPLVGTQKLWQENFGLVVVTLDREGFFYRTAKSSGFLPAFSATVVDTVGAGDGFLAGLLDGLRRGNFAFENEELVRQACRQAAAVGAITVTRPGAIPALPSRQEVDAFLAIPINSQLNF
ncbi:MAG: PfkB family carbohydrate kinase [Chloroflexota bacterium]|nr:hypothetical protein [Chloroflexota bacterium]